MDIFSLLELLGILTFFILVVVYFWRVSKLKQPKVLYLLDFVCYKSPFTKPNTKNELENKPELYINPNRVENVVFEMVDELLNKTTSYVKNIGVLVCIFNGSSTISLSSLIVKKYKLQEDIAIYDLNGKGCNSGFMAIILAKQLLQVKGDCCALVLITEQLPEGRQISTDSTPQCLPSGAAILLSNRSSDFPYSKYKLVGTHNVHVALSTNSSSYSDPRTQASDPGTQETEPETQESEHEIQASEPEIQVVIDPGTQPDAVNPGTQTHVSGDAKLASEQVVRSNVAFTSSLIHPLRRHRFSLCQVSGDSMVEAAERNQNIASHNTGASRTVLSKFGYEPITSLWYRFEFMDANVTKFDKRDCVSQMAFWSDFSDFKGSTLVWEVIRDVDDREMTKPMVCK